MIIPEKSSSRRYSYKETIPVDPNSKFFRSLYYYGLTSASLRQKTCRENFVPFQSEPSNDHTSPPPLPYPQIILSSIPTDLIQPPGGYDPIFADGWSSEPV